MSRRVVSFGFNAVFESEQKQTLPFFSKYLLWNACPCVCACVCTFLFLLVPAAQGTSESTFKLNRQFIHVQKRGFKLGFFFFNSLNPCVIILKGKIMVLGGCHLIKNLLPWPKFLIALDLLGLHPRLPPHWQLSLADRFIVLGLPKSLLLKLVFKCPRN